MASLLQQLENNEAVLLMYLSGELDERDTREVEAMLERDASMRAELQALRELEASTQACLAQLDSAAPVGGRAERFLRRVGASLRQREAERLAAAPPPVRGLRYPWWAYPLASAAAIIIAFLAWWGNNYDGAYTPDEFRTPPSWVEHAPEGPREAIATLGTSSALLDDITAARRLDDLDAAIIALTEDDLFFFSGRR